METVKERKYTVVVEINCEEFCLCVVLIDVVHVVGFHKLMNFLVLTSCSNMQKVIYVTS
jgi:hypothetical protein